MKSLFNVLLLLAICFSIAACAGGPSQQRKELVFPFEGGRKVIVDIAWLRNTAPPYYSDKGPMESLVIREGSWASAIPLNEISAIEDFWLDRVTLVSNAPGMYVLSIPYGVGQGSTSEFSFHDYTFQRGIPKKI